MRTKFARRGHAGAGVALLFLFLLTACAIVPTPATVKIALFAPFEGRYREIGYNALYAARLALADAHDGQIELLAVDDGGTQAASHAAALAQDPQVIAAVVLGYDGTSPESLSAFADIPVLVVGGWGAQPVGDSVFILSNPNIEAQLTASPRISITDAATLPAPVVGGEVFALEGFASLRDDLDGISVLSAGSLPSASFAERYQGSDPFAPEPGLLASLTYDAAGIAINTVKSGTRESARAGISAASYEGTSQTIRFSGGYWLDAPIHAYYYVDGLLTEDAIEQR